MQSLNRITFPDDSTYPIDPILIFDVDGQWSLAHDFAYLKNIHRHMNDSDLPPRVRTKHATAWNMTRKRHKRLLDALESNNFDPQAICKGDWSEAIKRVEEGDGP